MRVHNRRKRRSGSILVLAAVMITVMFGLVAFAVDIGYLGVVRSQLQTSADAAALAAGSQLFQEHDLVTSGPDAYLENWIGISHTRDAAGEYTGLNKVGQVAPQLAWGDIEIGFADDPFNPDSPWDFVDVSRFNAVQVTVQRTADQNGEISLFFAKALGFNTTSQQAEATAMFLNNIAGFRTPSSSSSDNLGILPITLDEPTWNALLAGVGTDNWTWNEATQTISAGPDNILEVNLFPEGAGSPGNRGTVDIGSDNNSTADISRQIVNGISETDMAYHNGVLAMDSSGVLLLNGDTGISAAVKSELKSIEGESRVVPIFRSLSGSGDNAVYTIVQFAGVRIMDVNLTGNMSDKCVIVQPAKVKIIGAIPAPPGSPQLSNFVYSPVWLVR